MWVFREASGSDPYPAAYFTPAPHPDSPRTPTIYARRGGHCWASLGGDRRRGGGCVGSGHRAPRTGVLRLPSLRDELWQAWGLRSHPSAPLRLWPHWSCEASARASSCRPVSRGACEPHCSDGPSVGSELPSLALLGASVPRRLPSPAGRLFHPSSARVQSFLAFWTLTALPKMHQREPPPKQGPTHPQPAPHEPACECASVS